MKDNFIYWKCVECGSCYASNTKIPHNLDMCTCSKSGVDAEEFYTRVLGNVKFITKEEFNEQSTIDISKESKQDSRDNIEDDIDI